MDQEPAVAQGSRRPRVFGQDHRELARMDLHGVLAKA